jgi:NAD(P)-dependent dehydrogenase (short-subunit alcohol dehydrogenase family)
MTKPLSDRVALVTGANRGIGAACASALGKAGAHVLAAARDPASLASICNALREAGATATPVQLDVADFAGIAALAGVIARQFGRVDVLVGNAGVLGPRVPLDQIGIEAWNEVMTVNVSANWQLAKHFQPLLQRSSAGRVVFVTSGSATRSDAGGGVYAISKAALNSFARIYAAEVAATSVRVNLFNPGPVRTRMRAAARPDEDPETLTTAASVAEKILELCLPTFAGNGMLYDFPTRSFKDAGSPGASATNQ